MRKIFSKKYSFVMLVFTAFASTAPCNSSSLAAANFIALAETTEDNKPKEVYYKSDKIIQLNSQPSDFFRSKTHGDWSEPLTWESSADNVNWVTANLCPTSDAGGIIINTGHTVKLTSNATARLLTIAAGATLTNSNINGGFLLTIENDGTSVIDLEVSGSYILFGTNPKFNDGATAVIYGNGIVRADDNYGGNSSAFASSPAVLFKTGSVFEWNNNSAFSTSGVTYFPNSGPSDIPIFRITQTASPVGSTRATTINGVLEVNSNIIFTGNGLKTFRDGITGNATLTLNPSTGGYEITSASAIFGNTLQLVLIENLRLSNGITIPSNAYVKVSTTNSKGFLRSGTNGGSFLVNGTLDLADVTIANTSGDVIINGTLKTSRANGLFKPGNIAGGNIYINEGSTIEYNANGDQDVTSSTTLGGAYYNITFSNWGIKKLKSTADVNSLGTVTITGPRVIVDASGFNLGSIANNTTNFKMDGGRLILGSLGTQPNMGGNYSITGGTIEFSNKSATFQSIRIQTYQNIEISGTSVRNSNGNILLKASGTFIVLSGGIFTINDNNIIGTNSTEKIVVETGGIFKTGNNEGFHGFTSTFSSNSSIHSNIINITLKPGSTVEYTKAGGQPITNANGLIYSNLILSGSGNKTAPSEVLTIQGNFSKTTNSHFLHNNGTVLFNGNSSQNYNSLPPQIVFNNLTNNNAVSLNINDSLSVYKELLLGENSKINLNKDITLKSDNYNTANVAQIPYSASIIYGTDGRFIVERYIPKHSKAWQLLSVPTKGSTINQSWQEGNNPGMANNIKPGYGTTITSERQSWLTDGFDLFSAGGPSMKTWDATGNTWIGVTSTNIEIANNKGYMIFVRGDRSVIAYDQAATATILRTRGKLYSPGLEAPIRVNVSPNSFTSVGNPFASSIDFSRLDKTNVDEAIYIWDPQLTTYPSAYGLGGYRTIKGNSVAPSGGNYSSTGDIPAIQSGQAFLVHNSTPAEGFISFPENCKVSENKSIFRQASFTEPGAQLRGNLYVKHNGSNTLIDGTLIQFDKKYSDSTNAYNAVKPTNSGENMGISSNGKILAIQFKPPPTAKDTVSYHLSQMKQQQYLFEFIAAKLNGSGLEVYLEDNYLKTKTFLNGSDTTQINFAINNMAGSYASNRFHIIFKATDGPLPVMITNVKAYTKNKNIAIEWKAENETGIRKYIIEKSITGNNFIPIIEKPSTNEIHKVYYDMDLNPVNGYNFYRIKSVDVNDEIKYSEIVKVLFEPGKHSIIIYPNPVKDGIITLHLKNQPVGLYKARLFNSASQLIFYKEFNHPEGSSNQSFLPNKFPSESIYYLEITKPDGSTVLEKLVY